MTDERRTDDRLPVLWRGTLIDENDKAYPCEIRDISHAGALATCQRTFEIGTDLLLDIDGLNDFAGRVKWQGTGALGLMLLAGDDLALKRFAERAGDEISKHPEPADDF